MIDKDKIVAKFQDVNLVHAITVLEQTDSTNNHAKEMIAAGAESGTIIIAEKQTLGRGRLKRRWHSPEGGLYFSIIIKANPNVKSLPLYGLMTGCVIHETLKSDIGIEPHLKWPNDIMVGKRKLCGILSELVSGDSEIDEQQFVVLGIGINVNTAIEDLPDELQAISTSLQNELNEDISLEDLLVGIVSRIDWWLEGDPSLSKVFHVYNKICGTIGRYCRIMKAENIVEGLAKEIDEEGLLLVQDDSDEIHQITVGEVEYLRSE